MSEQNVDKEIAKLDYIAIKNNAPFDIGCMPEDRKDPAKRQRMLMINSTNFHVAAGEFFVDRCGIGQKLKARKSWQVILADEAVIKGCSLIKPATYVFEDNEKKTGKVIGFIQPLQILSVETKEYYLAAKHVGGGVASAKRIAKLEEEASQAQKVKGELEKAKAEREAMLKEREEMLQKIAD